MPARVDLAKLLLRVMPGAFMLFTAVAVMLPGGGKFALQK
jgi:hypothetical protein